jgi:pilus assembly protein CpaB
MKWAITGLTVLGIAAAACAALLVSALRAGSFSTQRGTKDLEGDVQVIYANVALDSMTVVDGSMVASKSVKRSEAPPKSIADPVQVVGRVLTVAMLPGQAFTGECFATDRSASLAAAVGKGKRAVGISVTDYAGLEGLLYPGSVVDVFLTLKSEQPSMSVIQGKSAQRGALTATLLERVQVLAVEAKSVVSGSAETVGTDTAATDALQRPGRSRRVTLLVDTKQAKALQLGMEQGTLSLALRNPLDTGNADRDQVSLRSILGLKDEPIDKGPSAWDRMLAAAVSASAQMAKNAPRPQQKAVDPFAAPAAPKKWETTVIRGDKSQTYTFPLEQAAGDEGKSAAAPTGATQKAIDPQAPAAPSKAAEGDASPTKANADNAAAKTDGSSDDTVTIVPPPVAPGAQ